MHKRAHLDSHVRIDFSILGHDMHALAFKKPPYGHHAPRHDSYARSQSICLSEYSLRRDMMHMDSCGPAYNLSSYRVIRAGGSPSNPIAASSEAPPAEEPEVPSRSARGRTPAGSKASGRTRQFGKWCHEGAGVKLLRAGFVRVLARTHELRKQGSFQRTELRSLLYI